jgi:hypothetical protein
MADTHLRFGAALALASFCACAQSTPLSNEISPNVQAGRDTDALRILNRELAIESAAFDLAKSPEERERRAGDIAGLKREIDLTTRRLGTSPASVPAMAERRQKPAVSEVPPALSPVVLGLPKRQQQPQESKQ